MSGQPEYFPDAAPQKTSHADPERPELALIVTEAEVVMTAWQHRETHGLCYRDDCIAKYGKPLVIGPYLPFTPHG